MVMEWNKIEYQHNPPLHWKEGKLEGVKLIQPGIFDDYRGSYVETYDTEKYFGILGNIKFVQDDISVSRKDVLRGLHGNNKTSKLISIFHGAVYALIADNRPDSKTFKQWEAYTLSAENRLQLFVPAGLGNSMLALTDMVVYHYKQDTHFVQGTQFTIKWNDPDWNFWWPIKNPILSQRDFYGRYID